MTREKYERIERMRSRVLTVIRRQARGAGCSLSYAPLSWSPTIETDAGEVYRPTPDEWVWSYSFPHEGGLVCPPEVADELREACRALEIDPEIVAEWDVWHERHPRESREMRQRRPTRADWHAA